MKKLVVGMMICASIFLTGCGGTQQDLNTITIWHWMTDRHDAFVELASEYQEQTGITVNFQLFAPSDVYSQKIIAAAQARILPDVFGILDKKSILGEFIKSGFVVNLKKDFEAGNNEWKRWFFEKALAVNVFEDGNPHGVEAGIYGVPLDVTTIQMVYNKKLLKKAGFTKPPATFDDFISYAQKLRTIGVTPLVSGWSELWMIDCFSSNYAFNIMGEEKVMATYRGDVPYTDPDWIKVFEIFQTLVQKNMVDQGIVTKSNKFAEQDFALERAAFAFNGSWCVNVYHGMNPDLEYGVMMPPPVSGKKHLMIWGGAGSSFMVNERSKNKDKAVVFLKWFTQKEQQQFLSEVTKNLPSNRRALASLPEELSDFGKAMDYSTHPTIWPAEEDALVKERFAKGLQSIIIGESTPEEVAQRVQKVKDRQLKRAKRRR